jgi:AcrR family transcriptional regulator
MGPNPVARSRAYAAALDEMSGPPRGTPADAFRAAVKAFVDGPRLDMGRLAAQLGVSKATLYRWTGSREQLIGEVLSHLSERTFDEALAATAGLDGTERMVALTRHFLSEVVAFEPLRRFLRNETPLAFRVLTARGSVVPETTSGRLTEILQTEAEQGSLSLRAPAPDIAYAIMRVGEGFIYSDPVAELEPDIDAAIGIVRLLLE